ncbi:hypothetical protein [Zhihengliuella halotolerans]|uniref:hypothetical protein n=1 Tax=Zhihengliuella halotolerans TaxID=370736 RepID=UPI000C80335E|nr:hypothetical protein [Zhihengliuella halotolerans]
MIERDLPAEYQLRDLTGNEFCQQLGSRAGRALLGEDAETRSINAVSYNVIVRGDGPKETCRESCSRDFSREPDAPAIDPDHAVLVSTASRACLDQRNPIASALNFLA